MSFQIDEIKERFTGRHPLLEFLYQRWFNHIDSGRYQRIIWDLALIEAIIHPEMAAQIVANAPPENGLRKVHVYSQINAEHMKSDFYVTIKDYFTTK